MRPITLTDERGLLNPRPYQYRGVDACIRDLNIYRSTLLVAATGLGKTVMFAEIAHRWPSDMGRILVLAHRNELIEQARDKIEFHTGERPSVEQGDQQDRRGFDGWQTKVVVGSVQSMYQQKRLDRYNPKEFGLVVLDEAHHGTSPTNLRILDHFLAGNEELRLMGVTATPERADKKGLGAVVNFKLSGSRPLFESCAFRYDLREAIQDGWLCDIEQQYVRVEGLDLSEIKPANGDLPESAVEQAMMGVVKPVNVEEQKKQEAMLHRVLAPTIELAAGRPTLVFCVSVAHAERMAEIAANYNIVAKCVHGGTIPEDRQRAIAMFKAGDCMLIGCAVFAEGFDAPNCAVVSMARPTLSKGFYTQCVGRATRPLPGLVDGPETPEERRAAIAASTKPRCTVLDFVGNSGRHSLVSAADILAGDAPAEMIAAVKKAMADHKGRSLKTVLEELAAAQARKDAAKAREAEKRAKLKAASVDYSTKSVDAFTGTTHTPKQDQTFRGGASDKQVYYLVKHCNFTREKALACSVKQAGKIISEHKQKPVTTQKPEAAKRPPSTQKSLDDINAELQMRRGH